MKFSFLLLALVAAQETPVDTNAPAPQDSSAVETEPASKSLVIEEEVYKRIEKCDTNKSNTLDIMEIWHCIPKSLTKQQFKNK